MLYYQRMASSSHYMFTFFSLIHLCSDPIFMLCD
uniref:Uncharacterized protein n=1 Tax=Arundo donax TaxID=35708 RepID=A0A0A8Z7R6_ARUDO